MIKGFSFENNKIFKSIKHVSFVISDKIRKLFQERYGSSIIEYSGCLNSRSIDRNERDEKYLRDRQRGDGICPQEADRQNRGILRAW